MHKGTAEIKLGELVSSFVEIEYPGFEIVSIRTRFNRGNDEHIQGTCFVILLHPELGSDGLDVVFWLGENPTLQVNTYESFKMERKTGGAYRIVSKRSQTLS